MDTTTPKWIELDRAHNVRDLGGLPIATGVTRPGILVRADALDALTDADVARLRDEFGLTHVIDLCARAGRVERGRGRLGETAVTYTELADYAATQERMDRIVERLGAADAYQTIAEQVPAFAFEARAGTVRRFLGAVDGRWGGARSYFESNGASAEGLARWQALFVAAAPA